MTGRHERDVLGRLRRLEGQVRGIERMVSDGRCCVEIVTQIAAVSGVLDEVERILVQIHLERWVTNVTRARNSSEREQAIHELLDVWRQGTPQERGPR